MCVVGYCWAIPKDAEKPADARVKSGRYIGVSNKNRQMEKKSAAVQEE